MPKETGWAIFGASCPKHHSTSVELLVSARTVVDTASRRHKVAHDLNHNKSLPDRC